jgi:hypothetical protein
MAPIGRIALTVAVALAGHLLAGCGGSPSGATGPTATADKQAAQGKRNVTLELRDRFLYDHNAAFFGGRTGRWVPPVPIHVTGDPELDHILADAALAWGGPLGVGAALYQPLGPTRAVPPRGIFFAVEDLPGNVIGFANPYFQKPQGTGARLLRQVRATGSSARRLELPEVTSGGEIRRCVIILDDRLALLGETAVRATLRHEIGHCLGFLGHVTSGLMRPRCCALNITPNVVRMMQRLYSLAPGTEVTP